MNRDRSRALREDEIAQEITEHIETHPCASPLSLSTLEGLARETTSTDEAERARLHIDQCLFCLSSFIRVQSALESPTPVTAYESRQVTGIWRRVVNQLRRALTSPLPAWLVPITATFPVAIAILLWALTQRGELAQPTPSRFPSAPATLAMLSGSTCPKPTSRAPVPVRGAGAPQTLVSRVAAEAEPAIVQVIAVDRENRATCASGFFLKADGVVVTNYHVVNGARGVVVRIANGALFSVEEVPSVDSALDVALLKVPGRGLPVLRLGDSDRVRVGESVVAIGNPLGLENSVSTGIVSAVRRMDDHVMIQTTAPISPGSSGSPLLNEKGEVIGVATAAVAGGQNLNLAIGINEIKKIAVDQGPKDNDAKAAQAYFTGMLLVNKGDYVNAERSLLTATSLDPKNVDAWLDLGVVYYNLQKKDKEVEAYRKALELRPDNSDAHYRLGGWYQDRGQFQAAAKEFSIAISLDPKNEDALFHLALVQLVQGQRAEALDSYSRLRALNGGLAQTLKALLDLAGQPKPSSGSVR